VWIKFKKCPFLGIIKEFLLKYSVFHGIIN